ncbi:MAG: hypothetical protein K8963_09695, partial [Proteobacteria bacterium]|nr:hypothetical protein [Pseudomonadota bacterium]
MYAGPTHLRQPTHVRWPQSPTPAYECTLAPRTYASLRMYAGHNHLRQPMPPRSLTYLHQPRGGSASCTARI